MPQAWKLSRLRQVYSQIQINCIFYRVRVDIAIYSLWRVATLMKKFHLKGIIIVLSIIILLLSALNIISYYQIKQKEAWAEDVRKTHVESNQILEDKIQAIDNRLFELQDKYYEDKITKLLGNEKLMSYAKEQWQYSLTANNLAFEEDHIYLSTKNVTLVLSERQPTEKLLPLNVHKSGALASGDNSDKFYDHLIIESQIPYETKVETGDNYTNVSYTFSNVTRGTIITLRLSEPLKERLFLSHNTLEIIINKV